MILNGYKISRLLVSTAITVATLTGCSSHSGYWPSDPPIEKATACPATTSTIQSTTIQYNREGHFNTTELIAYMAGYDKNDALRFAFFSQVPDDMWFPYSAPSVGAWGLIPRLFGWSYHSNVMNVLHSLHDGDHAEVMDRRNQLKTEIAYLINHDKYANAWKIGFLIHALADSYAHVYGGMANLHGYNEYIGHMLDNFSHGNKPDEIVVNNNYLIYMEFVTALFESLKRDEAPGDRNVLSTFLKDVRDKVEKGHITEDELTAFISNYSACLADRNVPVKWNEGINALLTPAITQMPDSKAALKVAKLTAQEPLLDMQVSDRKENFKQWEKEIHFWEVVRFLIEIRYRL